MSTTATGLSEAVNLRGKTVAGLQMPSTWTDALVSFQGSVDGSTYAPVFGSTGLELVLTTTGSRYVQLDPIVFAGLNFLKIKSGDGSTGVAQASTRVFGLSVIA
jgi:hypothetical protein